MTDTERKILNHYNINTLYPAEWPQDRDDSDGSDEEPAISSTSRPGIRRSRSRYSALEHSSSFRSSLPGTEKTKDGVENLVQKDEPDPLGSSASVVQVLRQKGLPVEDDLKLRNRFLLSSTTFSPTLFLSQIHNEDSTESLLRGLDFLSRSIEEKSASLKVLVESNFERFVRAKATIDNVYTEMRNKGKEEPPVRPRPHSRHASKSSGHFRTLSNMSGHSRSISGTGGPLSPGLGPGMPSTADRKKTALTKESEYGVQGIKGPLLEAAVKAEEVWGPALGGRDREENLKAVLATMERNRGLFEIGALVQDSIHRKDYEAVVEHYRRARGYADEARDIALSAMRSRLTLIDSQVHQIIVTARMWSDVEVQIENFKRDVWKRLAGTHFKKYASPGEDKPEYMELINVLLELGVEDNPIWVWLLSRYDYLKTKISATSERLRVEIEILRRRLASGGKPSSRLLASHLRAAVQQDRTISSHNIDSAKIIDFWEHVVESLQALLSAQRGVLSEVIEFWETAQSFISGRAQRNLSTGVDGQSRYHHYISADGIKDLNSGTTELINMIRDAVFALFADPPIEDISMLLTPISPTPETPSTPISATLAPFGDPRLKLDPDKIPPPSPTRGEPWEKYAFWPPYATSLSGVQYLSRIIALIGTATSGMASLSVVREAGRARDQLRTLVGGVRERCVQAICGAWNNDAENCRLLEDWTRSVERRDLTNMPARFMAFESLLLVNMQKILFIPDAMSRPGSADVVVPPSAKILQIVRSQFVASLYKALSGMVENADKPARMEDQDADSLTLPARDGTGADLGRRTVDASNRNVRKLITLSNLQALRTDTVPQLISQFETHFSVKLTDESKTILDALRQIDARLFTSYVDPIANELRAIITSGITSPSWIPSTPRPTDAQPYVYTVLLRLVLVHTEVSTTSAPLTPQILRYLLEQVSLALIDAFKRRQKYTLPALMQATLDVEFMAQTLNNYTTDKASETQSAIYVALDERTDNEARMRLQDELQEMRAILKKLREGTRGEFACFKRPRGQIKTMDQRPQSRQ